MQLGALAFLVGIFIVQQLAELPPLTWCVLLIPALQVALIWRPARLLLWAACGFFWALGYAQMQLAAGSLAREHEGIDLIVEGYIVAPPTRGEHDIRFLLDVRSLTQDAKPVALPGMIRLSWRNPPLRLYVGERWRLQVRLKRPHGFMNPGGFDYEGWLFRQGIHAVGYVRAARASDADQDQDTPPQEVRSVNERVAEDVFYRPIDQWRQLLTQNIFYQLKDRPYAPIVAALAIGDTQGFSDAMWDVLNRTGTTHLISISGLHIGFIAGLVFFLTRRVWAWPRVTALWWPAPKAAAVAALTAATVYAALAGFSVPTQRSLIMIAVVMSALLFARHVQPSRVLALALLAVLLWDPFAVQQPGFWLSYGAVGVILWGMSARWEARGWWWKWGRVQWLVAVGMLPLMLVLFQRTSLVAPLANFIAVPWFNIVVVPLTLAGTLLLPISETLGAWLLSAAEWSIHPQWMLLQWMAQAQWSQWTQHVPVAWTLIPGLIGMLWLLMPRGVPARWLGGVAILPMFLVLPPAPRAGEAWFTLLDVGQGLSALVRTQHHVLVFDTGPRFNEHFDTGEAVVLPYLRKAGLAALDVLMLSHGDSDHVGGAASILSGVPVRQTLSSVPLSVAPDAQRCAMDQHWTWDGVEFNVLYPPPLDAPLRRKKGNDVSCVLQIRTGTHRILLTGDIEMPSEKILLNWAPEQLRADVLVVPHHGSTTSSSEVFVSAVRPHYALFPVGYRNRFRFPKEKVVERYRAVGAQLLDSAQHGAITFRMSEEELSAPELYRLRARRYWND